MYAVRVEALLTNVPVVLPQQKVPKTQNTILYLCESKENLRQASPPKRFHLLRDEAGVGREYRDFLVSTYVVCERLSVMHEPAGVVENLVQNSTEYPYSAIQFQNTPPPQKIQI